MSGGFVTKPVALSLVRWLESWGTFANPAAQAVPSILRKAGTS